MFQIPAIFNCSDFRSQAKMSGRRGGGLGKPKFVTTGSGLIGKVAKNLAGMEETIDVGNVTGKPEVVPRLSEDNDEEDFENIPDISMPGRKPAATLRGEQETVPTEEEEEGPGEDVPRQKVVTRVLSGPPVVFSSDEEDEQEETDEPHDEPIGDDIKNPISNLENITEEEEPDTRPETDFDHLEPETRMENSKPEMELRDSEPEGGLGDVSRVILTSPTAYEPEPSTSEMSFEEALSMISKAKKKEPVAPTNAPPMVALVDEPFEPKEIPQNDEDPQIFEKKFSRSFRQAPVATENVEEENVGSGDEFDRTVEIEVGDLRDLEEDETNGLTYSYKF